MTAEQIIENLEGVRRNGAGWMARCPNHDDTHASMSVGEGDDGKVLLHCFAGCDTKAICEAMGISSTDLRGNLDDNINEVGRSRPTRKPPSTPPKPPPEYYESPEAYAKTKPHPCRTYRYSDSFVILRFDKKDGKFCVPMHLNGEGWVARASAH